ncbi:MAG: DoxX family protein [Ilumatobacteraceae bacterium]
MRDLGSRRFSSDSSDPADDGTTAYAGPDRAASGLLIGLGIDRLGAFTALCLSIYFVLAVGAHIRVKDAVTETLPALVMLGLSVATFVTSL